MGVFKQVLVGPGLGLFTARGVLDCRADRGQRLNRSRPAILGYREIENVAIVEPAGFLEDQVQPLADHFDGGVPVRVENIKRHAVIGRMREGRILAVHGPLEVREVRIVRQHDRL